MELKKLAETEETRFNDDQPLELKEVKLNEDQLKKLITQLKTWSKVEMSEELIKMLLEPCSIVIPERNKKTKIPAIEDLNQAEEWFRKSDPGIYEEFYFATKVRWHSFKSSEKREILIERVAWMFRNAESAEINDKTSITILAHTLANLIKFEHHHQHHDHH